MSQAGSPTSSVRFHINASHSHCLFSLYYRSCKPGSITSSSSFSPTACSCLLVLIVLDAKNKLSHFCLGKIQIPLLFSRLPADADCFSAGPAVVQFPVTTTTAEGRQPLITEVPWTSQWPQSLRKAFDHLLITRYSPVLNLWTNRTHYTLINMMLFVLIFDDNDVTILFLSRTFIPLQAF